MTDRYTPPTVTQARGAVGGLRSHGATPDPAVLDAAKASLCCANLDAAIRRYTHDAGTTMHDAQVGHLVGLLLMQSGVAADDVVRIEADVRAAVKAAAGGAR